MSSKTAQGAQTMSDNRIKNLVITAFFTAVTFLGIQSFRIPLPAAVGTPFLHFGHIFVVMGILLQGGKRGAVSGTLGLTIFDLLNGYIQDAPKTFFETAVKCLIVGAIFMALKKKEAGDKKKEYRAAVICAVIYGCINIVLEFLMGTLAMVMVGSGVKAAAVAAFTSLPATVINAVFMMIAIAILYEPVKRVYVRMA